MQRLRDGFKIMAGSRRRSWTVVIVLSVILGSTMGLNMASRGLENVLLKFSAAPTIGEAYLETRCERNVSMTCAERLGALVQKYHGKLIGELTQYHVPNVGDMFVMDREAAMPFLFIPLAKDGLSVLTPGGREVDWPMSHTVVGGYPITGSGEMSLEGFHLSNLIMSRISGEAIKPMILVMDSEEVTDFFKRQFDVAMDRISSTVYQIVAFESVTDAKAYTLATFAASTNYSEIVTTDLFSNTVAIVHVFRSVQVVLNIITGVVILIAVFGIAILASSVIKETKSMRKAVAMSEYCGYVLVMNLLIIIGTILITGLVVLMLQLFDGGALAGRISEFYHWYGGPAVVSLWVFSGNCGWILGALLLLTPITLLLNYDKLCHSKAVQESRKRK